MVQAGWTPFSWHQQSPVPAWTHFRSGCADELAYAQQQELKDLKQLEDLRPEAAEQPDKGQKVGRLKPDWAGRPDLDTLADLFGAELAEGRHTRLYQSSEAVVDCRVL